MSKFSKFLGKFAVEQNLVGEALSAIVKGVGLDPRDREQIEDVISTVHNASKNILASIKDVEKEEASGVTDAQLRKVLKPMLEKMLPDMIGGIAESRTRNATRTKA